jgi:hypothetical protein
MEYAAAPRNKLSNTFEPAVQPETRPIENIVSAKQLLGRAATAILAHFLRQPYLRPHDGKAARSRFKLRAETGGAMERRSLAARLREL